MRFVRDSDNQFDLLINDRSGVIVLTDRLGLEGRELLIEYIEGDYDASEYWDAEPDHDAADVELKSPVTRGRSSQHR